MARRLPADETGDPGRSFANAALALGIGSILFICGSFALHHSRRTRTRVIALVGGALGLVPWLLFGLFALVFVLFGGGD